MTDVRQGITVSVPYFGCEKYIRRAVQSLLDQTHPDMTIVVVNDADPNPPWGELAGLNIPPGKRVIEFDLAANHGPYFAHEVVRAATSDAYLMIQDADDWSHHDRATRLLAALEIKDAAFAVSAQNISKENWLGQAKFDHVRFQNLPEIQFDQLFVHYMPHHGLFRVNSLAEVGGYYAGFRIGFDTLLVNILLMTATVSHDNDPLYYQCKRRNSLTTSRTTGFGTPQRRAATEKLKAIQRIIFDAYQKHLANEITRAELLAIVKAECAANISPQDRIDLGEETRRLREILAS